MATTIERVESKSTAPAPPPVQEVPSAPAAPPILLDEARWQRVLDATGGWAAACYQCGLCSGVCPWSRVRPAGAAAGAAGPRERSAPPVSVRHMVRAAQLGLGFDTMPSGAPLWLCTTCRLCEVRCPRGVPVTDVVLGLRELAWQEPWLDQPVPPALAGMLWDLHWDGNPWGRPPSRRAAWARGLDLPEFDPARHETLYYVGCTAAYDRRAQHVARALVGVLRAAGVAFGTLGEAEPCCGDAARSVGQRSYFQELVETNTRFFRERAGVPAAASAALTSLPLVVPPSVGTLAARGAGEGSGAPVDSGRPHPKGEGAAGRGLPVLLTTSPHCYDTFRHHYPGLQGVFQPLHYTQYLAGLIDSGRLTFTAPLSLRVTFHDPCVLGRGNAEYDAPRRILQAIPGVELVEMADNREQALCCGGGGGRMWLETPVHERFGQQRVAQAHETGAALLATACPYCISCLEDALKVEASRPERRASDGAAAMRVLDVAEIAWLALSGSHQ